MKERISAWSGAGFFVAAFWSIYFFPTASDVIANQPAMWALARITCPIVFASSYFHFAVPIFWALLANTATYTLIGVSLEFFRTQVHQAT
jgi:hypothetical protein